MSPNIQSCPSRSTDWCKRFKHKFEASRVLVTGGAGFIGSHLCDALGQLGAHVVALDDLSGGCRENLSSLVPTEPGVIELVEGSILDESSLRRAMDGCRYVFHQAALPSVPRSIDSPRLFHDVNVTGTQMLLDAAVAASVQRVMFAASSSAYGDAPTLPKHEAMPPQPKSPYAANKLAGEYLMRAYASCYDIDTVCLRYFNIFGPRQNANSVYSGVIAQFARALLANEAPIIYGDGEQTRDFTYVDNTVHANLLAALHADPIEGMVFNVACGKSVSINQLATKMADALDARHLCARRDPQRRGDVKHSLADLGRARSVLGFEPIVDFDPGLQITAFWYRNAMG